MRSTAAGPSHSVLNPGTARELAWFRYRLRHFLRFSEQAARAAGITPQQHQLMLGVAGFKRAGSATISELAEFLQARNNSVVGLVERAVKRGLVRRNSNPADRRQVVVTLTPKGSELLARLSVLHRREVRRIQSGLLMGAGARAASPRDPLNARPVRGPREPRPGLRVLHRDGGQ